MATSKHKTLAAYLFVAVFYAFAVYQGSCIKCWVCRSDGDPKCADPFDNTSFPITDCTHEDERSHLPGLKSTMCRKVRQKVNGEWRYIRSCAFLGEPGIGKDERYCLYRSGTYNIHVEYCTCRKKDGCNSADTTGISWAVIGGVSLLLAGRRAWTLPGAAGLWRWDMVFSWSSGLWNLSRTLEIVKERFLMLSKIKMLTTREFIQKKTILNLHHTLTTW